MSPAAPLLPGAGADPLLGYSGTGRRPPGPAPSLRESPGEAAGPRYRVRLLDNDVTTYEEVMRAAVATLGVSLEEAYALAWTIDHEGSAVVAVVSRGEAERIADGFRTVGIEVLLEADPDQPA